jgi:hypothetical protein
MKEKWISEESKIINRRAQHLNSMNSVALRREEERRERFSLSIIWMHEGLVGLIYCTVIIVAYI